MSNLHCDIRCEKCNRLLCKGCVQWIEIKCPRCGWLQSLRTDRAVTDKVKALRSNSDTDQLLAN